MRKLILSLHITPDGFCNHDAAVVGEDWMGYVNDLTARMGTAVFGRVTFELFEQFWPGVARERTPAGEMLRFADLIDGMEKIVFSQTMKTTGWNNTRIEKQLTKEAIDALKKEDKGDMIVFGGPGSYPSSCWSTPLTNTKLPSSRCSRERVTGCSPTSKGISDRCG